MDNVGLLCLVEQEKKTLHISTLCFKVTPKIAAGLGMALRGLNPKGRIFFHSFPRLTTQSSGLEGLLPFAGNRSSGGSVLNVSC